MKRITALLLAVMMLASLCVISVAADEPLTLKSATIISDTQIRLEFSEPVDIKYPVFAAMRYANPGQTKENAGVAKGTINGKDEYLQFFGKDGNKLVQSETNPCQYIWTIQSTTGGANNVYDVYAKQLATLVAFKNNPVFFCIEEMEYEADGKTAKNSQQGAIYNITAKADPNKYLQTNFKNSAKNWEPVYVEISLDPNFKPTIKEIKEPEKLPVIAEADIRPITVKSVSVLNEKQITVKLSEEVKIVGPSSQPVFGGIRYMTSKDALAYDGSAPLQYYGSFTVAGDTLIWTAGGGKLSNKKLSDVLKLSGYEDKGYTVQFCFEGMPENTIVDNHKGYIDNVRSTKDNKGLLVATKTDSAGIYDGLYIKEIENISNASLSYADHKYKDPSLRDITVSKVEIINERQIEITCSENVKLVGSSEPFSAVRFVDKDGNLAYDGKKPLQYAGTLKAEGNKLIWTKGSGLMSFADLLKCKGYENKGYTAKFCIEGMPDTSGAIKTPIAGSVDNVQSLDGKGTLLATKPNGGGVYDGFYAEITGIANASKKFKEIVVVPERPADDRPGVTLLSAKVLNNKEIQLKFSEPVKLAGKKSPWCCIRYVSYSSTGRPNYGTYKTKDGKTGVMQISGSPAWNNTDTVIWTIDSATSMSTIVNMQAFDGNGTDMALMFCIEGITDDAVKNPEAAYINNVVSLDGKRKLKGLLTAADQAKIKDKNGKEVLRNEYNGEYVPITGKENASKDKPIPAHPYLTLDSVAVMNDSQIKLTFSEPVKIVGTGSTPVFSAIRYTDNSYTVIKDETSGYLQFMGTLKFNDTAEVVWTMNPSSAKTMEQLFQMAGFENRGYKLTFCLEGMPFPDEIKDPMAGYIENIQSLDGEKYLLATKVNFGNPVYDGWYTEDILDKENASKVGGSSGIKVGVEVNSVTITGDYTLEIKFTEPVKLVGEGTAATQYCAVNAGIRFTDVNLNTQSDGGRLLEFAGDFELEDGSDTAKWTMRNQAQTIKELLAMEAFQDYQATFCIEGTADSDLIPEPVAGYVDNIQNMEGTMLLIATKSSSAGIEDGFYTSDILEAGDGEDKDDENVFKPDDELIDDKKDDGDKQQTENNGLPVWIWIVVGGVVVAAAAVVAILLSKKKKK